MAAVAPRLIFAGDDEVAPDVVWASTARLAAILGAGGWLYAAPELVVEVLAPGPKNIQRDRQTKLKLYARRGVDEYWIVDWPRRMITLRGATTKSRRTRLVPVGTARLLAVLEWLRLDSAG